MYFIAEWESSWNWANHNYSDNQNFGDPFTLGIMAWAGSNCYYWLLSMSEREPDFYATIPETWRDAVNIGPDAWQWGGYSMGKNNADAWVAACQADMQSIKEFSEWYWIVNTEHESLYGELQRLHDNIGVDLPDDPDIETIKKVYFYIARYHNCGTAMQYIWDNYGFADWETLRTATIDMYESFSNSAPFIEGWTNAINGNVQRLQEWDGETCPDFGQVDIQGSLPPTTDHTGGRPEQSVDWQAQANYMDMRGDALCLHMVDGTETLFYKASSGHYWIPERKAVQTGTGRPSDSANPDMTGGDIIKQVMQWYLDHEEVWGYSLGPGSAFDNGDFDDSNNSHVTNCSACIRFCAKELSPTSEMANLAQSYTGDMAVAGEFVMEGDASTPFDYSLAQPGDVLLVMWNYYNPDFDHVELFLGTAAQGNITGSELWGAGSPPCPHRNEGAGDYIRLNNLYYWQLRRIGWEPRE